MYKEKMIVEALNNEIDLGINETARLYWINSLPVSRTEFLYELGNISDDITKKLKSGAKMEIDGKIFRIDGWDLL